MNDNFFTDPESIAKCVELVDKFEDQGFRLGCDPWETVDFHGRVDIVQELSK